MPLRPQIQQVSLTAGQTWMREKSTLGAFRHLLQVKRCWLVHQLPKILLIWKAMALLIYSSTDKPSCPRLSTPSSPWTLIGTLRQSHSLYITVTDWPEVQSKRRLIKCNPFQLGWCRNPALLYRCCTELRLLPTFHKFIHLRM